MSIFTPSSGGLQTRYIICLDYHAVQYINHAHKLHVTTFIYSVSSSFASVSKLSLMWCLFVLCYRVTMVGRYGVMGRRLTDPTGFYLHSSVVLCTERVLSRKNRH